MTRMNPIGVLLMASALVAAACANEPEPLSSEEFTARASEICEEASEQIRALGLISIEQVNRVEEAGTYQEMADYFEGVVTAMEEARDQLGELPPPPEDAEMVGEFLFAVNEMIELTSGHVAALRAEDLTGWENVISRGHAAERRVANLALQAGLLRCTQSLGVP